MMIQDGHGSGAFVKVVNGNKLYVKAVSAALEHEINHDEGESFNVVFNQSPTAADDCIFYMVNSDETDLVVEELTLGVINCTADDTLYFKIGDTGTRNGATALTPVAVNGGSGKTATGTFEKGADLDGGAATLADGAEFDRVVFAGATDLVSTSFNFAQDVILPKNRALTIWIGGSATGTYYITVHFNYHDKT